MTAEAEEDPAATVRRTGWRLTGVEPEGADLPHGPRTARLRFRQPVLDPESARAELVRLARLARSRLPTASQSPEPLV